ncbi:hypothetical protein [Dyadobacter bucti]|uniref:hypothetical protein n=1 Tax=Dyadobacter bucti TaxID=2572203 RepID=UPI001E48B758|nr:hypothetical protein [Dyadobacter bucti]
MKNSITTLVFALALSTTVAFGNTEDKAKVSATNTLPASTPSIETPAPQHKASANDYAKYTASQKASIVELKMTENIGK